MFERLNGILARAGFTKFANAETVLAADADGAALLSKQTTDDTPTNVVLLTPAASRAPKVTASITAVKSDGSVAASWEIGASCLNTAAGTLTLLGATTHEAEASGGFAPTAEINVDGDDIVAILTGIAATTINWKIDYKVVG